MKSSKKRSRNRSAMEHSPSGSRHKRQSRRKLEMKPSMKRSATRAPADSAPCCTALASIAELPARRGLPTRISSFRGSSIRISLLPNYSQGSLDFPAWIIDCTLVLSQELVSPLRSVQVGESHDLAADVLQPLFDFGIFAATMFVEH